MKRMKKQSYKITTSSRQGKNFWFVLNQVTRLTASKKRVNILQSIITGPREPKVKGKENEQVQTPRWPRCWNYWTKNKTAIITISYDVKVNALEMNKKARHSFSAEKQELFFKKETLELQNTVSEIHWIGSKAGWKWQRKQEAWRHITRILDCITSILSKNREKKLF